MEHQRTRTGRARGNGSYTMPSWALTFALLASTIAAGSASSSAERRMLPNDGAELTQYRAIRRMHVKSDRLNHEGWMEARTELDDQGFRYEITSERGSEYVRNKVMRTVLQREQELIAAGQTGRAALTEDNYVFSDEDEGEDGYRYVLIKPRRKEVTLVDGRMVIAPDGSLLRVEGRLAKNPSFWTSLVNVTRHFATVDGVRVPVSTESIAKVKFAGQSRLDVSYEYESINGRPVTVAARQTLALASRSPSIPE